MSTPKFAKTHNLVAFLKKPSESEGFEQIVGFLNANPIKNALIVNPTIYISCIQQFWDSAKVKTVNEDVHIRALIDEKKIIVTEASIRHDLQLQDAKGLKRMYKVDLSARIVSSDEEGLDQVRMNKEEKFSVDDLDGDEVIIDVTTGENVEQDAIVAKKEVSTTDGEVVTTAKEPKKPLKKKDQIALDEEVARKLEAQIKAEIEEEERIARETDEANIALIE
nr:hypothetical protein [Tanacetum cinerariifolium]